MAFVGSGLLLAGAVVAGGVAYESNQAKQKGKTLNNVLAGQAQQDAMATAKSQSDAAIQANNVRVAQKRAYQANALALGGNQDDSLGAPGGGALAAGAGSVLMSGQPVARGGVSTAGASSTAAPSSALGGGASYGGGSVGRSSNARQMLR
jgi:hypothetical protein